MTASSPPRARCLAWILLALLAFGTGLLIAHTVVIRPWHLRYNMSDAGLAQAYPGDEYVPDLQRLTTRSIQINVPAEQ